MEQHQPSEIVYHKGGGVTLSGPDASEFLYVAILASAMILYKAKISPGPGTINGRQALTAATKYTGVKYRSGEYDRAKADLKAWIETRRSAIPTRDERGTQS